MLQIKDPTFWCLCGFNWTETCFLLYANLLITIPNSNEIKRSPIYAPFSSSSSIITVLTSSQGHWSEHKNLAYILYNLAYILYHPYIFILLIIILHHQLSILTSSQGHWSQHKNLAYILYPISYILYPPYISILLIIILHHQLSILTSSQGHWSQHKNLAPQEGHSVEFPPQRTAKVSREKNSGDKDNCVW